MHGMTGPAGSSALLPPQTIDTQHGSALCLHCGKPIPDGSAWVEEPDGGAIHLHCRDAYIDGLLAELARMPTSPVNRDGPIVSGDVPDDPTCADAVPAQTLLYDVSRLEIPETPVKSPPHASVCWAQPPSATDWSAPTELPDLRNVDLIAIDTEERDDGLNSDRGSGWATRQGYICGMSVAYRADGEIRRHYFPIRHPDTQNFDPPQVHAWVKDHFAASKPRFATQNGLFDYGWLRAEAGIRMPSRIEEISALAAMVDENRFKYSLDALCEWRGLPGKDETLLRQAVEALGIKVSKKNPLQAHIHKLPARYVGPYAEQDPVSTLLLHENLNPILDREGTRDAYRLECDLLPMVQEMRLRGIRFDTDAAGRTRDHLLKKRDAALAELSKKFGHAISMDELRSDKWKVENFDRHGIKYPLTELGNPSFKAGKMGWMGTHPHWLPQLIAAANKYDNAAVAGPCPIQKLIDHTVNGRIHAEIHPHLSEEGGAKSFRLSYSDPPLQQIPSRDEELGPLFRKLFLPEDGLWWCSADCSQQEFRLLVHHAAVRNLPGAIEAAKRYLTDPATDFHRLVSELTGLLRKDAKGVNFASIYGAGIKKFAEMIGKSLSEAQAIRTQYDILLPFVWMLARDVEQTAKNDGYLTLYDNARRHFDKWAPSGKWEKGAGPCDLEEAKRRLADPKHPWFYKGELYRADVRTALNALIQGDAARHTKLWMRAVYREGVVPHLQMHDALEFSVDSYERAERVARLGEEAVQLRVPMRVDLKFGKSWGDATHEWEARSGGAVHEQRAAKLPTVEMIAKALGGHKTTNGWIARCPAHDDQKSSLLIRVGKDGKMLLYCLAGCSQRDILHAIRHR